MQIWCLWKKKSVQDRGIYRSSRTLRRKKREKERKSPTFADRIRQRKKRNGREQRRRSHRLRRCRRDGPKGRDIVTEYQRCPCISRSAIRIYAPSLATIPLRKELWDGFSRSRQRPPTTSTPYSRDACSRTSLELLTWGTRNRCTRHTWSRGDSFRWRKGVAIRSI